MKIKEVYIFIKLGFWSPQKKESIASLLEVYLFKLRTFPERLMEVDNEEIKVMIVNVDLFVKCDLFVIVAPKNHCE